MITKEIEYSGKYLPTLIVKKCFEQANYSFVDKVLTGNGFTTGFLEIRPTHTHQSNIIIVPNKQVVISKQQKQLDVLKYGTDNEKKNLRNIGFFFGDDSSDKLEFGKFDTMMFVVDSFLNYSTHIVANKNLIDKILIDEVHSMLIQSTFRNRLVGFIDFVKDNFTSSKIVSVTATPMLFNKIDIKLIADSIPKRDIHITTSQTSTLKRIKTDLNNNKKVLVALQDARLLKKLANEDGVLDANVKVGETLFRKVVESVDLKINIESNLTIISSAGFEGFDVENGINKIYIFEDRAFDYQTFYSQNIPQIIGRSRQGTNYIEWCRMANLHRTEMLSKEDMIKKVNSDKISFEKKMTDKNYKYIPKYFNTKQDVSLGLITDLTLDHTKYDLDKELTDTDLKGLEATYKDFFKDRGFSLIYLNEGHKRLNLRNVSHKTAFKNLKLNAEIIKRFSLMSGISLNLWQKEKTEQYIREYEIFFRRKYWYLEKLPFGEDFDLMLHAEQLNKNLDTLENELFAYSVIINEKQLNVACNLICKDSIEKKLESVGRKSNEFKTWKIDLIANIKDRYIRLVMGFSQDKIKLPKKLRNSRDYNLLTEVSMELVNAVAELYDTEAYEIDIISCNIRIIYSLCGLSLPSDFYGKDKVNKKRINSLLNRLSIDFPQSKKHNVEDYKNNRIQDMRNLGFDEKVINFLMHNFWYESTDAVFNFCAYHEKNIIDKLRIEIDKGDYKGMVRRHDSIIYFGEVNEVQLDAIINFEYMGQYGWFRDYDIIKEFGSVLNEKVVDDVCMDVIEMGLF